MGKRRRQWKIEEAQAVRRRTLWRRGTFLLLGIALLGAGFFLYRHVHREERLIRLAAERGWFVFGMHIDPWDFSVIESHLEEAFKVARERGQRVVFIEELGGIGLPRDQATRKTPAHSEWLARLAEDPGKEEALYHRRIASLCPLGGHLKRREFAPPHYYQDFFGPFAHAVHDRLIQHWDLLEDVVREDLTWTDYCDGIRMDEVEERAWRAFPEGKPDSHEKLMREKERLSDENRAGRDRNLLLQMGKLMDGRDDLVVVTVRGIGHWGMVEKYSLRQTRRVSWDQALKRCYGIAGLLIQRLKGTPASAEEERRCLLAQLPGRMLENHLLDSGLCVDRKEASHVVEVMLANPALGPERFAELSLAMAKVRPQGDHAKGRFVCDWMVSQGFLAPIRHGSRSR
jgi:hypothetical protein